MKTDIEIQNDVMEELKWEPSLNPAEIGVGVKHGIVSLSGNVDTYAEKVIAEKATKRVEGVKAVAEEICVKIPTSGWRSDTDIAESILNTLKWQAVVDESQVKIKVENGWVTLEGTVDWLFEKNKIVELVENLLGVRGITCMIKVAPKIAPKDVKKQITAAFHRSASIEAKNINIESVGNTVVLSGKVRSFVEKMNAEEAALFTPGVTDVTNNIEVDETLGLSE
jgi:osmotically-inducible protein OsmY